MCFSGRLAVAGKCYNELFNKPNQSANFPISDICVWKSKGPSLNRDVSPNSRCPHSALSAMQRSSHIFWDMDEQPGWKYNDCDTNEHKLYFLILFGWIYQLWHLHYAGSVISKWNRQKAPLHGQARRMFSKHGTDVSSAIYGPLLFHLIPISQRLELLSLKKKQSACHHVWSKV